MRRALRKRRVFDFVPSYLKLHGPSLQPMHMKAHHSLATWQKPLTERAIEIFSPSCTTLGVHSTACFMQLPTTNFELLSLRSAHRRKWTLWTLSRRRKSVALSRFAAPRLTSQLMGSTMQVHGVLACVPRGCVLRPRALLNTEV